MRFLFTTLQTYESEFYGRVGDELQAHGHEVSHVTISREAARLLRERGADARCLSDIAAEIGDPASLEEEVRRLERPYEMPHSATCTGPTLRATANPSTGASNAPSATFARSSASSTTSARRRRPGGRQRDDADRRAPDRPRPRRPRALPALHDLSEPTPPVRRHDARADRRAGRAARADARRNTGRSTSSSHGFTARASPSAAPAPPS